jgi:RNA polymerase sigma-70 factor (ECF subfamily)
LNPADEAMARYAQGDAAAFDAVYEGVAPRLEGYLRRHVRGTTRVEDIIQQTFLQMHAARWTFSAGAEVFPWALAIARRLMFDVGRRARREEYRDMQNEGELDERISMAKAIASGEEVLEAREIGAYLSAAYDRLSEPQRVAFELVKTAGLSHAQAATVAGTSVTGIKLRVHRAYVALRAALDQARAPLPPSAVTSRAGGLLPAGGRR